MPLDISNTEVCPCHITWRVCFISNMVHNHTEITELAFGHSKIPQKTDNKHQNNGIYEWMCSFKPAQHLLCNPILLCCSLIWIHLSFDNTGHLKRITHKCDERCIIQLVECRMSNHVSWNCPPYIHQVRDDCFVWFHAWRKVFTDILVYFTSLHSVQIQIFALRNISHCLFTTQQVQRRIVVQSGHYISDGLCFHLFMSRVTPDKAWQQNNVHFSWKSRETAHSGFWSETFESVIVLLWFSIFVLFYSI